MKKSSRNGTLDNILYNINLRKVPVMEDRIGGEI